MIDSQDSKFIQELLVWLTVRLHVLRLFNRDRCNCCALELLGNLKKKLKGNSNEFNFLKEFQ